MKALCWHGKKDIRCDTVPDPAIEDGRDAIVKVTSCAICGSDLHLFGGFMPGMEKGDILGHEFMGEVVEVGADNRKLKVGDRVVVPFTICCGECEQCRRGNWSHSPQQIVNGTTTRSPIFSFLLSAPTSTTSPMNSWPMMSPDFMPGRKPPNR